MNQIHKLLVTNLRDVRSLYRFGYSVRNYNNLTRKEYEQEQYLIEEEKIRKDDADLKANFDIN